MKSIFSLVFLLLLMQALFAQSNASIALRCLPYLQNMTEEGVTIIWLVDKPCTSYILFGESKQPTQKAFASHHGLIDANLPVQKIRISNLKPGKTYFYQVVSKEITKYQAYRVEYGDSVISLVYSFTLPTNEISKFNFLAFNDLHDKPAFIEQVCKNNPDFSFVCLNGDILTDVKDEEQVIKAFCQPFASHFANGKPFFYTRGNHETRGEYARALGQYLDLPNGEFYYTFTWGNTCFIVLDTGEDKADSDPAYFGLADFDHYRSEQGEWLKMVMDSETWKNAGHRIVCGHIPVSLNNDKWHGSLDLENKILPVLNNGGVDLYICGHTHEASLEKPGKNHNYTMAVSGAPIYYKNGKETTYIKVSVDNLKLEVGLYKTDGTLIDHYSVK